MPLFRSPNMPFGRRAPAARVAAPIPAPAAPTVEDAAPAVEAAPAIREVVSMNVEEAAPDASAPRAVVAAAIRALRP